MNTATKLLTVEEYDKIPNPPGGIYELHHGELVLVTYPKQGHKNIQRQLRELLGPFAKGSGIIETEFPFRAEPEYELRGADVAFVSKHRVEAIDPDGWLMDAPELVIEYFHLPTPSLR